MIIRCIVNIFVIWFIYFILNLYFKFQWNYKKIIYEYNLNIYTDYTGIYNNMVIFKNNVNIKIKLILCISRILQYYSTYLIIL